MVRLVCQWQGGWACRDGVQAGASECGLTDYKWKHHL